MVILKATPTSEAGVIPDDRFLVEMLDYDEDLVKAGVLLAGEGLHPSSKGKRVRFAGGQVTVIDGPFAEPGELVAGFWLWELDSMDEAVAWVRRCPTPSGLATEIEIRQVFEAEDYETGLAPELDGEQGHRRGQPA